MKGGVRLNNQQTISKIIKDHISLRGKTVKEVAYALNMNTKTLYDQLQHNRISAAKLLDLAAYLDIDLEVLKNTLGYNKKQSYYQRFQPKRMSKEYKNSIIEDVLKTIKVIADKEYSETSLYERVLSEYKRDVFFLLDVLLDEDYEILISSDDAENNKGQKIIVKRIIENLKLYDGQYNLNFDLLERNGETVLKELINKFEVGDDMFVVYLDSEVIELKNSIIDCGCEDSLNLGRQYHNKGKYELAIICFNNSIEICDNFNDQDLIHLKYEAITGRALSLLENGNIFEAETELENLLTIYSDSTFIRERLLEIYEKTNNCSEGNKVIDELLREDSYSDYSNDELLAKKLYFLAELNDKEEEINCCNLIIKTSCDREFRKYARTMKEIINNDSK